MWKTSLQRRSSKPRSLPDDVITVDFDKEKGEMVVSVNKPELALQNKAFRNKKEVPGEQPLFLLG